MSQSIIVQFAEISVPENLRFNMRYLKEADYVFPFTVERELKDAEYKEALQEFTQEYSSVLTYNFKENLIVIRNKNALLLEHFHEAQRLVKAMSWEQFSDNQWRWSLKEVIYPQQGVYIYYHGYFQTFLSFLDQCKNGDIFYIGGILDYKG